jgi:hypothetical protein
MRALIILLLLTGVAFAQANPTVYYDPDKGSDANPGTKEQPFRTKQKAESVLIGAGQIISPIGVTTYTGPKRWKPPGTQ